MESITKNKTKREIAIDFFTQKSERVENYKNQIIIFEYTANGFPCASILHKREIKPSLNYKFKREAQRADFIGTQKNLADKEEERDIIRLKNGMENANKMNVCAILYSSWGYEQTNVDFYIIIARSGVCVTLQEIGCIREYDSRGDSGTCMPNKEIKIGEPFRKRINKYGNITLNSYSYASIYDGKPKCFSCYA